MTQSEKFWEENQVGGPYTNLEESNKALKERLELYPTLYELMPVNLPGKVILDYGCGPGHDVVLFLQNKAKRVFYYDISPQVINVQNRVVMHGLDPFKIECYTGYDVACMDHIHCSGVLHHTENPLEILKILKAALKPGGEIRIMIYDGSVSQKTQSLVPITNWWTREEFIKLFKSAELNGEYVGGYPCSTVWRKECITSCWRLYHY